MSPEELASHELYRERYHHKEVLRKFSDIPEHIEFLNFWRKGNSHKGIAGLKKVNHLTATGVNNSFFDEICELKSLESLVLCNVEVNDISLLNKLPKLRYLELVKLKPCAGLACLIQLPRLQKLWISESKDINDYHFLKGASKLVALGVEGDTWTNQKIDSLKPFAEMEKLEALFMSSVQLKDKNLNYVASNPNLKYFSVSRFAPKKSFEDLCKIRPDLICQWFDNYDV
jgi:Leucine-rich repeat (LRR) protein